MPRLQPTLLFLCVLLGRSSVSADSYYLTRDDLLWPADEVWESDLASRLSENAALTLVFNSSSAAESDKNDTAAASATVYAEQCESLGNDSFALSAGGHGICMQAHHCARRFCQLRRSSGGAAETDDDTVERFNLPAATVDVRTPQDIAAALEFAATHKIAVTVKTSGHSYAGSSTGRDSLLIWMHHYPKDGTVTKNYQNSCGDTFDAVLGIGGGENFDDVLEAVQGDYHIVTGYCRTVSAAGGWLQGVGLSHSTRTYGFGIDQVVDFTVVLANGTVVTADACSNPDLFWALRGGGGGTFGVVTHVHYKLHPATPITSLKWGVGHGISDAAVLRAKRQFMDFWARTSLTIDHRWSGGFLDRGIDLVFAGSYWDAFISPFMWKLGFFYFRYWNPLLALFSGHISPPPIVSLRAYASWYDYRGGAVAYRNPDKTQRTGFDDWFAGARIIPKDVVEARTDEVVDFLHSFAGNSSTALGGYFLGGADGEVGPEETAVHPAMRRALWAIETPTPEVYQAFVEFFPNSVTGSSFNHHFVEEIAWRESLWGDNYERLLELKERYDPEHVFNCWHCVGYRGKEYEYSQ